MYNRSAAIYDAIYHAMGKDYAGEAEKIEAFVKKYKRSDGNSLLDVGCGTGSHIPYLQKSFQVQALDKSDEMLVEARRKHPGVSFHWGDMADFELDQRFDVITCLFSAIGYAETLPRLAQTGATFARHLKPGGVMLVEPWFGPGILDPNSIHGIYVDEPELKIARMNVTRLEGKLSFLDFHYMVGTASGIDEFCETHVMGIFTDEEYEGAFKQAGLEVVHDQEGLDGRGLYIGIR